MKIYIEELGRDREFHEFYRQTEIDEATGAVKMTTLLLCRMSHKDRRLAHVRALRDAYLQKVEKYKKAPTSEEEPYIVARVEDGQLKDMFVALGALDVMAATSRNLAEPATSEKQLKRPTRGQILYQLVMSMDAIVKLLPEAE